MKEAELLISGADIVVGTPFRLLLHLGKENMSLSQLRHLVIDEADTLCDTFYREDAATPVTLLPTRLALVARTGVWDGGGRLRMRLSSLRVDA